MLQSRRCSAPTPSDSLNGTFISLATIWTRVALPETARAADQEVIEGTVVGPRCGDGDLEPLDGGSLPDQLVQRGERGGVNGCLLCRGHGDSSIQKLDHFAVIARGTADQLLRSALLAL